MKDIGLVLIGHGSKLPQNRENLEKLAGFLMKRSIFKAVEICFMVRNKPTIPEAIDTIAKKGVKKIILIPAFLAPGVHTTKEIPELIEIKSKESQLFDRGIQLIYGEPIGADERIAEILEEKALQALGKKVPKENQAITNGSDKFVASTRIYEDSINLIRPKIQDALKKAPKKNTAIIERVVHTTADPEYAKLLVISDNAVEVGIAAIRSGAKIVTDVKMVKAGINESRVKKFGGKIVTYIDDRRAAIMAHEKSITKSVAAMRLAVEDGLDGAIVLIGNAPTVAFELVRQVQQLEAKPALIVATAVGYVGAAESKEAVSKLSIPYIIVRGRKGGSTIAVAVFNALLNLAEQKGARIW